MDKSCVWGYYGSYLTSEMRVGNIKTKVNYKDQKVLV